MISVILAGGLGTRISEETHNKPKPLVPIGGKPILWHIMMIYYAQGVKDFIIAGGYKVETIEPEMHKWLKDFPDINWDVLDTGLNTATGGRIRKCFEYCDAPKIFATYGDGVSDVNLINLLNSHNSHNHTATLTCVRPPARFGRVEITGNLVTKFGEKNQSEEGWINGGFFVLNRSVIELIESYEMPFELDPLSRLADQGKLGAHLHEGFWQPMDTLRERNDLESLWDSGVAPWKTW